MPRSAQGVCHSARESRFVSADVGLGVEMCAGKVEYTAWEGDRLRRCREKCGEVRMEDAVQSVSQGLSAQMSGKRRRGEYGRGGNRFFAGAQNDKRALGMTERVHVRREVATQGVSQGLVAQMSV